MFFRNFLMFIASLALLTGCPTDEPSNGSQDTSAQVDGGGNDGGVSTSDSDTLTWKDVEVQSGEGYALITAKTPDNKPATFYVCNQCPSWIGGFEENPSDPCRNMREPDLTHPSDTQIFKDIAELNLPTKASIEFGSDYTVCVERQNHLFVPIKFNLKGAKDLQSANAKNCEWKNVGSWGLAPNKTCTDSFNGKKKSVSTSIKENKVTLMIGTREVWVTDHSFSSTDLEKANGIDLTGTINEDGSVITYHISIGGLSEDHTLTCE
jgi:hypothetical protein